MTATIERGGSSTLGTSATAIGGGRWVRIVAVLIAVLYLIELVVLWLSVAGATEGDDGVAWIFRSGPDRYEILEVTVDSPAYKAGIRRWDTILAIDDIPASDEAAFREALLARQPGDSRTYRVLRESAGAVDSVEDVLVTLQPRLSARPGDVSYYLVQGGIGLLFVTVVVFVAVVRPNQLASRLMLIGGGGLGLGIPLIFWHVPAKDVWPWQVMILLIMGTEPALAHLFLSFPAPHPILARLRILGPLFLSRLGGSIFALYVAPLVITLILVAGPPSNWLWIFVVEFMLVALMLTGLVHNYRHPPTPLARAQLKWIVWAMVIAAVTISQRVVAIVVGADLYLGTLSYAVLMVGLGVFPVAVGLAILRYRLFDVSAVLRATVLYSLLAAVLIAGYLALVFGGSLVATSLLGPQAASNSTLSVLAVLAVAALFHPVRMRLQRALDWFVYRDRLARQLFLREATDQLGYAQPQAAVAAFLTAHSAQRLGVAGAWLALGGDDERLALPPAPAGPLIARLGAWLGPALIVAREDLDAVGLPALAADEPAVIPWYEAGARLLVPLRTGVSETEGGAGMAAGPDTHGGVIGVWALGARQSGDLFEREDLAALAQVGQQAAVLLDYARLHREQVAQEIVRHELAQAWEIQKHLLPPTLPGWPGQLEIAARFRPARETSGDFYDVLALAPAAPPNAVGPSNGAHPPLQIAVGDVMGKGIAAAMVMSLARATLRGITRSLLSAAPEKPAVTTALRPAAVPLGAADPWWAPSPAMTMRLASELLHQDVGPEEFVACAVAVVEPSNLSDGGCTRLRLRLANAGQVPPLLCRGGQAIELVPPGERLPLGVLLNPQYEELTVELEAGDVVVFASDGLPEAPALDWAPESGGAAREIGAVPDLPSAASGPMPGEFFGFDRLVSTATRWATKTTTAEGVAAGIWADLAAWCGESSPHDDMTLVVLRVPAEKYRGNED